MSTTSTPPQPPSTNDPDGWAAYWKALDQPWRTQPEIDGDRQNFLKKCLAIVSDLQQEEYPFQDVTLSRADVEWLLATRGGRPVNLCASVLQKINLSNWGLSMIRPENNEKGGNLLADRCF